MQRCLQLAGLGAGAVAPNPMVGAVLVFNNSIIGEGYHEEFGKPHAEVNCINSVAEENKKLIDNSILYVSLEPCNHFGKTPPCTELIIQQKIPTVVIACRDTYHEVNGKGIEKLEAAGVKVITGILQKEARALNKCFFTYQQKNRPYIILKWAQSGDEKIAGPNYEQVAISNEFTNRLVHKWRSEIVAIMVGTNTALKDNPSLNNRFYGGNNPVRIVIDQNLILPSNYHLLDGSVKTIVFNAHIEKTENKLQFTKIDFSTSVLNQVLDKLFSLKIQSVLVEGGTILLQSFIDEGLWDEARIIKNDTKLLPGGIAAPVLTNFILKAEERIMTDTITYYQHKL